MPNSNDRSPIFLHPASFGLFNIELTNKCPMKCVMCPRTKNMTRKQGHMEFDLFKKAVDELIKENQAYIHDRVVWLHHFGESLAHPRFADCIGYATSKGVRAGLSINPIMLTRECAQELLTSEPFILYISLDGHDDDSFYRIRGVKNAYADSHDRLMEFLRLKKKQKNPVIVILSMIDFALNDESVGKKRLYWESMDGVDGFLHKKFTFWDGNCEDIMALSRNIDHQTQIEPVRKPECGFPFETMTVLWDGDVVPCCFDYDKRYTCGNLRDQTLAEIWNGERMISLRNEFIANRVINPLCINCEKLYEPRRLREW